MVHPSGLWCCHRAVWQHQSFSLWSSFSSTQTLLCSLLWCSVYYMEKYGFCTCISVSKRLLCAFGNNQGQKMNRSESFNFLIEIHGKPGLVRSLTWMQFTISDFNCIESVANGGVYTCFSGWQLSKKKVFDLWLQSLFILQNYWLEWEHISTFYYHFEHNQKNNLASPFRTLL